MRRQLRLRHRRDFARLRREGRVFRHPLLLLSVAPNQLTHNRYAVIVGKRVGNAVTRNRFRRLIRESLRLLNPTLHKGYDMVVVAHPTDERPSLHTMQAACKALLHRANLIHEG